MSTRASIIVHEKQGIHIYQELLDDMVHLEKESDGVLVDVVLMPYDEWVKAGLPTKRLILGKEETFPKPPT